MSTDYEHDHDGDDQDEEGEQEIVFLAIEQVEAIHEDQLARYGGGGGYTNRHAIASAVEQPKAFAFGQHLYEDVADMASVYLYHISESQGFRDGNKRTGAVAAYVFLQLNGYDIDASDDEFYLTAKRVSEKQMTREDAAAWIRDHIAPAT